MTDKHIIPSIIKERVEVALAYYPQLKDIHIEFKIKKNIKCRQDLLLIVFLNLKKIESF